MSVELINLIVQTSLGGITLVIAACAAVRYGHALSRNPGRVRWISDWVAIEIARLLGNAQVAAERERMLLKPERVQKIGQQLSAAGYALLALGVLQLLAVIVQFCAHLE